MTNSFTPDEQRAIHALMNTIEKCNKLGIRFFAKMPFYDDNHKCVRIHDIAAVSRDGMTEWSVNIGAGDFSIRPSDNEEWKFVFSQMVPGGNL